MVSPGRGKDINLFLSFRVYLWADYDRIITIGFRAITTNIGKIIKLTLLPPHSLF
jgi:hypothetical protein